MTGLTAQIGLQLQGYTCRNIPKPWKQVVKYNIPVFISIGQNYFTAFYVSKLLCMDYNSIAYVYNHDQPLSVYR